MKKNLLLVRGLMTLVLLVVCSTGRAQLKYSNGKLTMGEVSSEFDIAAHSSGLYLTCKNTNFLQIDTRADNPRLAGTGDQVVFYNTQKSLFNSIQV